MRSIILSIMCLVLTVTALSAQEEADAPPPLPPQVTDTSLDIQELTLRLVPLTKDELAQAAAEWLGIVKAKTEEVVEAQIAAAKAEGAAAEAARERLGEITQERKSLFDAYATVVDSWEKKGGDEAAVAEYRAYRSSIIVEETRTADVETLTAQALAWATARDGGVQLLIDIGVIVASLLGLLIVARIMRVFARRAFRRVPNLSKLLQAFLVMVVYWLVMSFGLLVVLSALGVDVSPVFALIGGASFIMAYALQDTLGNLAAGLMIMINRPFDEGDYVDIGGVGGTVKSVSVSSTTVTTPDNQVIVIPNAKVWGSVITNVTSSETRRVDLVFGIGYDDSIETAQRVLEETVAAHPLVMKDPAPVIRVNELADSAVNFIVRPWVKGGDYWTVHWDLTRQVKEAFDAADISIPYPQQDVHFRPLSGGAGSAPVSRPSEAESRGEKPATELEEGHTD
ncbi:MAG: mechanosensitive ion channel domain-containing protein [Pseudomonadota bacterium]